MSDSTAYTDALEGFLATGKKCAKSTSVKEWFDNPAMSAKLRSKSSKFVDFVPQILVQKVSDLLSRTQMKKLAHLDQQLSCIQMVQVKTTSLLENLELLSTVDTNCVSLVWKKTETGADSITSYNIWFQECQEEKETGSSKPAAESSPGKVVGFCCTPTAETKYCIDNLFPGTKYEFWVQAVSDIILFSVSSEKCCGNTQKMRLSEIALKPNPFTETDYLELFIALKNKRRTLVEWRE